MSSLRNAVKRVTHKERSQPQHRKKLGLLEKHSDYIERANDFKKKRKAIKTLQSKADERNPDEFYFKMNKSEVKNGKHVDIEARNKALDQSTVQLLKTQDMGYIVNKKTIEDKKIEKLKSNLHLIGAVQPRHKVFCESAEEVDKFDVATHFQTLPELASRTYNRPRVEDIEAVVDSSSALVSDKATREASKRVAAAYDELHKRVQRRDKINTAMEELHLQRNLMGRGTSRKIKVSKEGDSEDKFVYKWKRQRNR